ncbi:Protein patched 1 [Sparganum proliferum]
MYAAKSLREYKVLPAEPPSGCYYSLQLWLYGRLVILENFLHVHLWKIFSLLVLLALLCFGLKMATTQVDFYKLWVDQHSALAAELEFPAQALRNAEFQRLDPMFGRAGKFHQQQQQTQQSSSPLGGPPGSEFLNSVEAVIQTVDYQDGEPGLLNPKALRDHIDLLIKIHRLEVTVHKSKWKLEDLCRRAELPAVTGMSHIQSYMEDIIPCLVVTPADCFYEGSNALAPGKVIHVPWFNNQFMLQWPNLNPLALLRELQSKYENQSRPEVEALVDLLLRAGVDQGYLTRPCLDPMDLSCPKQAANHRGSPPDVARILSAGCPGFAANILHWPEEIIVGGRRCSSARHAGNDTSTVPCPRRPEERGRLRTASTLQSLILLRSPMDLYRTVYQNDPYKLDVWTLADAQNVLDQWRDGLKQLLLVHNQAISPALPWRYSTLTDNTVRELFSQNTYQIPVMKILGAVFLMLLYSLLCLLGWREPSRSQCWLALFGLALSVLALLAGLGVCAIFGLHFNVLTVQVLPFLALGLGMEGLFTFTTCHTCMLARGIAVARKNGQPTSLRNRSKPSYVERTSQENALHRRQHSRTVGG